MEDDIKTINQLSCFVGHPSRQLGIFEILTSRKIISSKQPKEEGKCLKNSIHYIFYLLQVVV